MASHIFMRMRDPAMIDVDVCRNCEVRRRWFRDGGVGHFLYRWPKREEWLPGPVACGRPPPVQTDEKGGV